MSFSLFDLCSAWLSWLLNFCVLLLTLIPLVLLSFGSLGVSFSFFFLNINRALSDRINYNMTRGLQLCPVFHFTTQWISNPRNGQNMTFLWPKHGPHMILQMGFSWILIDVPRDAPCQISFCWLNPVAPSLRNGTNVVLLWPKHGPHMVLQTPKWTKIT